MCLSTVREISFARDAVTEWTVVTTDLSMYMMVVPSSATWTTWLSNTYMQSACESAQATYRRDRHAGVKVRRKARQALTLSYRVRGPVCGRVPVSANAVCNRTGRASPCCLECCEESQKESRLIRRVDLSAENPTRPAVLPPPRGRHPAFRSDILQHSLVRTDLISILQDRLYRTREIFATPLWSPGLALFLVATPIFSRLYEISTQTERRHCRANILLHIVTDLCSERGSSADAAVWNQLSVRLTIPISGGESDSDLSESSASWKNAGSGLPTIQKRKSLLNQALESCMRGVRWGMAR